MSTTLHDSLGVLQALFSGQSIVCLVQAVGLGHKALSTNTVLLLGVIALTDSMLPRHLSQGISMVQDGTTPAA